MPDATRHVVELALADLHALEAQLLELGDLDDDHLAVLAFGLVTVINLFGDVLDRAVG